MTRIDFIKCMDRLGFKSENHQYVKRFTRLYIWISVKEKFSNTDNCITVKFRCGIIFYGINSSACLHEKFVQLNEEQLENIVNESQTIDKQLTELIETTGNRCLAALKLKKK